MIVYSNFYDGLELVLVDKGYQLVIVAQMRVLVELLLNYA